MLTTHVVSQGLAEELRASGWPQKRSVFSYFVFGNDEEDIVLALSDDPKYEGNEHDKIAAPLASELGEMLPDSVHSGGVSACLTIQKTAGNFWTAEYVEPDGTVLHERAGAWLPDALAALWLHLKKEGLLK